MFLQVAGIQGGSVQSAHLATCLLQNQASGRAIPKLLRTVQVKMIPPCRKPTPFQHAAPEISLAVEGLLRHQAERQCVGQALVIDHPHSRSQFRCFAPVQALTIEKGTVTTNGRIQILAHRIINPCLPGSSAIQQGQTDTEDRHAGGEIARAIQRIQTPKPLPRCEKGLLFAGRHLLPQKRDIGVALCQALLQKLLAVEVSAGDDATVWLARTRNPLITRQEDFRRASTQLLCNPRIIDAVLRNHGARIKQTRSAVTLLHFCPASRSCSNRRMPRIHLFTETLAEAGEFLLPEAASHHLLRVLRARRGQELTLFSGDGREQGAKVASAEGQRALLEVQEAYLRDTASPLHITLAVPVLRGERWDWLLQKAAELGVQKLQPLHSRFCQVPLSEARNEKRLRRWREILIAAAEQSQATRIVQLAEPLPLAEYLPQAHSELRLVFDAAAREGLRSLSPLAAASVELLTGPEGGLAAEELEAAQAAGFQLLRCGPRILRAETAPIAALAILQAQWGDIG